MPENEAQSCQIVKTGDRFSFSELIATLCSQIPTEKDTIIIAIRNGGVSVAEHLKKELGIKTPIQYIDIAFYRDDYSRIGLNPSVGGSQLNLDIDDKPILLVDDVFHTGRTVRAALNEIFDYGRPKNINLAVLARRTGRELPIEPQYCAQYLSLTSTQQLVVTADCQFLEVRHAGGLIP